MKLLKFRVKNYKSIQDSGDCYLSNGITVLAGRNESGKTSILEALEDFNTEDPIRKKAIHIVKDDEKPIISITFQMPKEEFNNLFEEDELDIKCTQDIHIEIIKTYPDEYRLGEFSDHLSKSLDKKEKELQKTSNKLCKQILSKEEITEDPMKKFFGEDESLSFSEKIEKFITEMESQVADLKNEEKKKGVLDVLDELDSVKNELTIIENISDNLWDILKTKIPNFILFKPYETLPNKVPIEKLSENEFIEDLSKVSDLDIETIKAEDDRKKQKHKNDINLKFNKEYQEYWDQDETNIKVDWDSKNLLFWVEEEGVFYEPDIRSKGKQWYLAFYIKLTARANEDKDNIILIDEPGLYLHARAQKDILKKLEKTTESAQVVFSTHSPYLIHPRNLDRVRLVIKDDEKGTKIVKITAKADKETLAPILTAIGEDLTLGIRTDHSNSIVTEGFSDYVYICSFRKLLQNEDSLNFVPAVGGDTSLYVGAVLFGWGLDPIFVLDKDTKGKKVKKKLLSKLGINKNNIVFSTAEEGAIEDVLSISDFKNHILEDSGLDYSINNSQYIKSKRLEKILLAKKFKEKVENNEINLDSLDTETKTKINNLFQEINEALNDSEN